MLLVGDRSADELKQKYNSASLSSRLPFDTNVASIVWILMLGAAKCLLKKCYFGILDPHSQA